jgi:hypothetical protein
VCTSWRALYLSLHVLYVILCVPVCGCGFGRGQSEEDGWASKALWQFLGLSLLPRVVVGALCATALRFPHTAGCELRSRPMGDETRGRGSGGKGFEKEGGRRDVSS